MLGIFRFSKYLLLLCPDSTGKREDGQDEIREKIAPVSAQETSAGSVRLGIRQSVDRATKDGRLPPPDTYNGRFPLWSEETLDAHDAARREQAIAEGRASGDPNRAGLRKRGERDAARCDEAVQDTEIKERSNAGLVSGRGALKGSPGRPSEKSRPPAAGASPFKQRKRRRRTIPSSGITASKRGRRSTRHPMMAQSGE